MKLSEGNRRILRLALPAIVTNVTVPLLSLTDTAIVGHLGATRYIGGIAVGGMVFNMIYWIFGFLRMGMSGLTAQAFGAGNKAEAKRLLLRSLAMGAAIGLLLIALQQPLLQLAFRLITCSPEVEMPARTYFDICIWGAPAVLMLYGLSGWFLGMQNSRCPMYVALFQNVLNIVLSLVFVFVFHMKIEGVAAGTLLSQCAGVALALVLARRHLRLSVPITLPSLFNRRALLKLFRVNRDIFLRTLCLVCVMTFFTSRGAAAGDGILAANALLMQMFLLFSFFMDGFAYAGEALSGRYLGAAMRGEFMAVTRRLFAWGFALALIFSVLYLLAGKFFLLLLTNRSEVVALALCYLKWMACVPLISVAGFIFDGIYIGATATRAMLVAVAVAAVVFFAVFFPLAPIWGNHALWLAFVLYLAVRGATGACFYHSVVRKIPLSPMAGH